MVRLGMLGWDGFLGHEAIRHRKSLDRLFLPAALASREALGDESVIAGRTTHRDLFKYEEAAL